MKSIGSHGFTLLLVLLLYCSPLPFIFGNDQQRYVLPCYIALQFLLVIWCYKFFKDPVSVLIIIIEAICMTWNLILFLMWDTAQIVLFDVYSQFMFLAFVLEILILKLSTGGGAHGLNARRNAHLPDSNLLCRLNYQFGIYGRKKVAQ